MIERISITCFLTSYAIAWLLEISRPFFKSGIRGAVMLLFGVLGVLTHTLFLGHRALAAHAAPLSSEYDFYLLAAWVLAIFYLYLTICHPRNPIGLFVLPIVLLFLVGAGWFADPAPLPRREAGRWWATAHGICLLLGTVAVAIGFATGLMYLLQARRLKHKVPPSSGLKLPSLEWLERVNGRTFGIAVLMLGGGFLSGVMLNLVRRQSQLDTLPWNDPVVLSSSALMGWMLVAWLFNVLYKPAQQGRKVAYLTVASFLFLVVSLVAVLADTRHARPDVSLGRHAFLVTGARFDLRSTSVMGKTAAGSDLLLDSTGLL